MYKGYELGVNAYVVKPVNHSVIHRNNQRARFVLGNHQRDSAERIETSIKIYSLNRWIDYEK